MKPQHWVATGFAALIIALGIVKVCNELAMTPAYERQAVALGSLAADTKKIADILDRSTPIPFGWKVNKQGCFTPVDVENKAIGPMVCR